MEKSDFKIRNDENKTWKKQIFDDCACCKEFENHIQVVSEARKYAKKRKAENGMMMSDSFSRYAESFYFAQNSRAESSYLFQAYRKAQ